jgi:hypothetical protein
VLLDAAYHELTYGTHSKAIGSAADELRAIAPQHSLVRLLDAKLGVSKKPSGVDGAEKT